MSDREQVNASVLSTHGIPDGTVLKTPAGMPNIVVKSVSPLRRVVVRVARVYGQSLLGFLPVTMGAGQALANELAPGKLVLPTAFFDQLVLACAFAVAPSVIVLLTNLVEWLVKQDSQ